MPDSFQKMYDEYEKFEVCDEFRSICHIYEFADQRKIF